MSSYLSLLLLARFVPIIKCRVEGNSMYPALKQGDTVIINRFSYLFKNPSIGDIVLVKKPKESRVILKRVTEVKNDLYFLSGDNKKESTDSRKFGYIQKKHILGKMLVKL